MSLHPNIAPDSAALAEEPAPADYLLRHLNAESEWRASFAVMQELRPMLHSEEDYLARLQRQRQQHYKLLAIWQHGEIIALAGYRLQENLIYGRFLYVDDLVVTGRCRGGQWGARLLQELEDIARFERCEKLVLDTGLSNALAQRFYFRQGLLTGAIRFSKVLGDTSV